MDESLYQSLKHQCMECNVVTQEKAGRIEGCALFNFGDDYKGFDGHFPGQPVLPAIVQLAAVRYTAEKISGEKLYPSVYSRTKFQGIVRPEEIIELHIRLENNERRWDAEFSIHKKGVEPGTIANGNCVFVPVSNMSDKL